LGCPYSKLTEFRFVSSLVPTCFVKEQIGLLYPTCVLSRSIAAFCCDDLAKSIGFHPYDYLLVLFFYLHVCLRTILFFITQPWLPWIDMGQLVLIITFDIYLPDNRHQFFNHFEKIVLSIPTLPFLVF